MKEYLNDFPMLKQDYVYFNSASTSLKPQVVINEMVNYYQNYSSNISRGVDFLGYKVTKMYEESRETVANFINASKDEIVFTRGTTESLNMIAYMLENEIRENDEVIVTNAEHHSNFLPYQELCKRKSAKLIIINVDNLYDELKEKITDKTKIVAIHHVSNVLGNINDLEKIASIAHKKNAYVIIDGAQGIIHEKVDVKKSNIDFYAFSGHKIYGPTGVGVLYGKKEILNRLKPHYFGGEMIDIVKKDSSTYKKSPHKFEAGTMMIPEVLGLKKAIEYFDAIGFEKINNHISDLRNYILSNLKELDVEIYNEFIDTNLITFNFKNIHSHDVASVLDKNKIIVRAGHHCAAILHESLNINSSIRISIAFYNTKEDADKLIDALKKVGDYINVLF